MTVRKHKEIKIIQPGFNERVAREVTLDGAYTQPFRRCEAVKHCWAKTPLKDLNPHTLSTGARNFSEMIRC